MPLGVKIIFTILGVAVLITIAFVNPTSINSGPSWLWRGGTNDPLRRLLFTTDGAFRKYAKVGSIIWLVSFIAMIWLLLPTSP
jgi:hypothetical protein